MVGSSDLIPVLALESQARKRLHRKTIFSAKIWSVDFLSIIKRRKRSWIRKSIYSCRRKLKTCKIDRLYPRDPETSPWVVIAFTSLYTTQHGIRERSRPISLAKRRLNASNTCKSVKRRSKRRSWWTSHNHPRSLILLTSCESTTIKSCNGRTVCAPGQTSPLRKKETIRRAPPSLFIHRLIRDRNSSLKILRGLRTAFRSYRRIGRGRLSRSRSWSNLPFIQASIPYLRW